MIWIYIKIYTPHPPPLRAVAVPLYLFKCFHFFLPHIPSPMYSIVNIQQMYTHLFISNKYFCTLTLWLIFEVLTTDHVLFRNPMMLTLKYLLSVQLVAGGPDLKGRPALNETPSMSWPCLERWKTCWFPFLVYCFSCLHINEKCNLWLH